jgi:Cys-tRNA(Pro)/Cys-tRNA(Cys) deacylase
VNHLGVHSVASVESQKSRGASIRRRTAGRVRRGYSRPAVSLDFEFVSEQRALDALAAAGITFEIVRHGPVGSLAEAAAARSVEPAAVVKTIVVRRGEDDFLFVLVPGDRTIGWPKLRALLGVSRLSMPDAATAKDVTGYERGTITPFGSLRSWPVIADDRLPGRTVSIGAGAPGVAATVDGGELVRALGATVADVTNPEE